MLSCDACIQLSHMVLLRHFGLLDLANPRIKYSLHVMKPCCQALKQELKYRPRNLHQHRGSGFVSSETGCRNRGTECIRAPEMLLMSGSSVKGEPEAHARHAGAPCDVWALGCLLYELVAGSVLFPSEPDWSKFYLTVTDSKQVSSITCVKCLCLL